MAEAIDSFRLAIPDTFGRLYFFIDMVLIVAGISFILAMMMFLNKRLLKKLTSKENRHYFRFFALVSTIGLLVTSSWMLKTHDKSILYTVMGLHFFFIKYLANFVVIEGKRHKVNLGKDVQKTKLSNNLILLNVNFLAIITTVTFVVISSYSEPILISAIFMLEIVGVMHILLYFGAGKAIHYMLLHINLRMLIMMAAYVMSGIICIFLGKLFYLSDYYFAVGILVFILIFGLLLSKSIKLKYILIAVNGGISYGVVLLTLMSSLLIFFLKSSYAVESYEWMYTWEPIISLIVTLLYLSLILKHKISDADGFLFKGIFNSGYLLLPFYACIFFVYLYDYPLIIPVMVMFFCYSLIEYNVEYSITQIIYKTNFDNNMASAYNLFFSLVREGIVPATFIILIKHRNAFYCQCVNDSIFYAMGIIIVFSFIINISLHYFFTKKSTVQ